LKAYIFPMVATWILVLGIFVWAGWLGPPKYRSRSQVIFWIILATFWIATAVLRWRDGSLNGFTVGAIVFGLLAALTAIIVLRDRRINY
jgi:uncharacterized membrane protein (DUF106 family)